MRASSRCLLHFTERLLSGIFCTSKTTKTDRGAKLPLGLQKTINFQVKSQEFIIRNKAVAITFKSE